jgi:uncharacterized membrane protein
MNRKVAHFNFLNRTFFIYVLLRIIGLPKFVDNICEKSRIILIYLY